MAIHCCAAWCHVTLVFSTKKQLGPCTIQSLGHLNSPEKKKRHYCVIFLEMVLLVILLKVEHNVIAPCVSFSMLLLSQIFFGNGVEHAHQDKVPNLS